MGPGGAIPTACICPTRPTRFSFLLMARKLLLLARELKASVILPGQKDGDSRYPQTRTMFLQGHLLPKHHIY